MSEQTQTADTVDVAQATEMVREADAVLIDIRQDYEWDAGRLPGATHIEINRLAAEAESLPQNRPVIFYCRTGSRSEMVVTAFREAGFDAYHLGGGMTAWIGEGEPIEPPDGEVAPSRPI